MVDSMQEKRPESSLYPGDARHKAAGRPSGRPTRQPRLAVLLAHLLDSSVFAEQARLALRQH